MSIWRDSMQSVDALALKWRALMVSATLLIVVGLSVWLIGTMLREHQAQLTKLHMLPVQGQQLNQRLAAHLDAGRSDKIKQLKQQIEQAGNRMDSLKYAQLDYIRDAAGAQHLRRTVDRLLRQNGQLILVRLEALSAKPLLPQSLDQPSVIQPIAGEDTDIQTQPAKTAEANISALAQGLYKHGIRLTVRGSYFDLLAYLEQLEDASLQIFWHELNLKVETYPYSTLSLSLFTISRKAT